MRFYLFISSICWKDVYKPFSVNNFMSPAEEEEGNEVDKKQKGRRRKNRGLGDTRINRDVHIFVSSSSLLLSCLASQVSIKPFTPTFFTQDCSVLLESCISPLPSLLLLLLFFSSLLPSMCLLLAHVILSSPLFFLFTLLVHFPLLLLRPLMPSLSPPFLRLLSSPLLYTLHAIRRLFHYP